LIEYDLAMLAMTNRTVKVLASHRARGWTTLSCPRLPLEFVRIHDCGRVVVDGVWILEPYLCSSSHPVVILSLEENF